jgi:hypothetical protein
MIRRTVLLATALAALAAAAPTGAAAAECDFTPRTACFGIESVAADLSTEQAGDHPDVSFSIAIKEDPKSKPNVSGLRDSYATTRNIRFNLPPGLIGNPNALGTPQQCSVQELVTSYEPDEGGCPNGSQVGVTTIGAYQLQKELTEPIYMMQPPGGDVVARVGTIAGTFPTFIDIRLRSEGDYGLVADVRDASASAKLLKIESTLWGVPADESHDTERCTPSEVLLDGCIVSESRPPGSTPLPFFTNPTRCGVPLEMGVNASSWIDPELVAENEVKAAFPTITGCDKLPFGPNLTVAPTNRRASAPTGLDVTIRLAASDGVDVLEPSQMRDIKVTLPKGLATNPAVGDGVATCSAEQVKLGKRVNAECPDAAKLAGTEFDIPALSRRMRGAIYLREPEPGNPFRIWVVADDLGAHVKLEGQLNVDKQSGQIESIVLDAPQAPLREVKLLFKSGFRAPLVNPPACGDYLTHYEFTPWSGGPPRKGDTQMKIDEGCAEPGFAPKLSAGPTDPTAGKHSPFLFTLTREDGEQNPAAFDVSLPQGFAATFAGIPRCDGQAALSGACPAASRIGKVIAAIGAGPTPLWVPQPGKRPTAIYLATPYKGAPLSIVAVVPRQAGPFDFGDEVIRSPIYVDPVTAQATARTEPLPQIIEGIPIRYRTVNVQLDRPGFALNPTSCAEKQTEALLTSTQGAQARPTSPFTATNCAKLPYKPRLSFRLRGGTRRGAHPSLRAVLKPRPGDANSAAASVALPHSAFLDQAHIKTVCTRVQFAAHSCPPGSIYGNATAKSPLFEETLSGPVYLRSSSHPLPDLVVALKGPDTLPIEVNAAGRIDSVNGGIRSSFDFIPDAPLTSFVLTMQGGKKGLLVNSTNLCAKAQRATAKFSGQNGAKSTLHPLMQVSCGKG